jgi:hypothetical protein
MSTGTEKVTELGPKPRVLRIFISYAKEDQKIAIAVYNAIQTALGAFADVFIDDALRFGLKFQDEIKKRLDQTDVLKTVSCRSIRFTVAGLSRQIVIPFYFPWQVAKNSFCLDGGDTGLQKDDDDRLRQATHDSRVNGLHRRPERVRGLEGSGR